ncbi:MAG: FtsH protease activity modulator HflK [Blastocatellia bacterium]|nr:FtsH protease activity modulator HflK [Blastocatellia bacterium]
MIIVQHLSYDHLEEADGSRWAAYALFTAAVGGLLLAHWQGYLPTVFGVNTALLLALFGGYRIYYKAIAGLFEKRITAELAIVIAIGAALAIGEYIAAAEAVLIMLIGEGLEEYASRRTRKAIEQLIDLAPERARIKVEGEGERDVPIAEVRPGDVVIVRPGERIPVDGTIRFGCSSINEAPITGESLPVEKGFGETVYAGSVNTVGALEIAATGVGEETTLARIVALIENAERQKAPAVRLADRYATWFLPLLAVTAAATFYFTGDWLRTVAVLLVACPCALILATPAAVVAGIGRLARAGVLVKSGAHLEAMAGVTCFVFDKTGTLTAGRPVIDRIACFNGRDENDLLKLAALAEQRSEHAIARRIVEETRARGLYVAEAEEVRIEPGLGVEARANGTRVVVGNRRMLASRRIALTEAAESALIALEQAGGTPIIVVENEEAQGAISVCDELRAEAGAVIRALREAGIARIVLLTGDRERVAQTIGRDAGVDEIHAELLPARKVELIERLKRDGLRVAMVGDGINDAPALAAADVGIAMGGGGTDIAIEEAGIVLMNDRLERLPLLLDVGRATLAVIRQNVWGFALAFNLASVAAASLGWLGPAGAAATHQVSALLVVLNALRLLAYGQVREHALTKRSVAFTRDAGHWLAHLAPRRGLDRLFAIVARLFQQRKPVVLRAVAALFLLVYGLSGLTLVGPDEVMVVQRFGRRAGAAGPGLHLRWPWPVEQTTKLKPRRVQVAELGFRTLTAGSEDASAEPPAYEWNLQHRSGRYEKRPDEALMLTGDENLIEVNAVAQYAIGAPEDYLFAATAPANLVAVAAESALRSLIGKNTLDAALTTGRREIERQARDLAQRKLDEYHSGARILGVQLLDVHPSLEVVDAFRNVAGASEEKNTLINQAEAYRNEQLELARGQALARLAAAAGYTTERGNRAQGDAERFIQAEGAFRQAPGVTETRLYLESIEQVLAGRKKLILDGSRAGRRQLFFLDPQGMIIDPAALAAPEKRE